MARVGWVAELRSGVSGAVRIALCVSRIAFIADCCGRLFGSWEDFGNFLINICGAGDGIFVKRIWVRKKLEIRIPKSETSSN